MKKLSECKSCQKRLAQIMLVLSSVALVYIAKDVLKLVKSKKK